MKIKYNLIKWGSLMMILSFTFTTNAQNLYVEGDARIEDSSPALDFHDGTSKTLEMRQFSSGLVQFIQWKTTGDIQYWTNGGNTLYMEAKQDGTVLFNAGDVGIGTTNPAVELHVVGDTRIDDGSPALDYYDGTTLAGSSRVTSGGVFQIVNWSSAVGDDLELWTNGGSRKVFDGLQNGDVIFNAGDVGIGSSSPGAKLEVQFTGTNGILVDGNDSGDARVQIENGGGNHYLFDDDSDAHALKLESANEMAFNVNGVNEVARFHDLGAGVGYNFTVGSSGNFNTIKTYSLGTSTGTSYAFFGRADGSGGTKYGVYGITSSSTSNNYGVYGSAPGTGTGDWALYGSGNIYYTGIFTSTSDERLKKNIRNSDYGLKEVMQLRPASYEFRTEEVHEGLKLAQGINHGFIAQELESVMPEMVKTDNHIFYDNPEKPEEGHVEMEIKSVNYINMISVLTKAIQEQNEIIEAMETRLAELENK